MIAFAIFGWSILLILALGLTFALPWIVLMGAAFSGNSKENWFALIPFALGCLALYGLFTHSPFHISLA